MALPKAPSHHKFLFRKLMIYDESISVRFHFLWY